jgi:hypothetical protein
METSMKEGKPGEGQEEEARLLCSLKEALDDPS